MTWNMKINALKHSSVKGHCGSSYTGYSGCAAQITNNPGTPRKQASLWLQISGEQKKCTGVAGRAEFEINVAGGNPVILDVLSGTCSVEECCWRVVRATSIFRFGNVGWSRWDTADTFYDG